MMISTQELLDTSVAQLRTLSAFLDEQLCQRDGGSVRATSETKACNEILQSLRGLIVRCSDLLRHDEPDGRIAVPCRGSHESDSWYDALAKSFVGEKAEPTLFAHPLEGVSSDECRLDYERNKGCPERGTFLA